MLKKVLVVDDQAILNCLSPILETAGYQVETASNGYEGLEAVQRNMPDLIIVDLNMPVKDGCAFTREFRAQYGPKVPIVILTAATDGKKRTEEIGAVAWLRKPLTCNALLAVVGQHLEAKRPNLR